MGEGAGCGLDPEQPLGEFVRFEIETTGTKDADATGVPGDWLFLREYFVWLPSTYDPTLAYPVVLQAPGCGGTGEAVYPLVPSNEELIRVGLTPPPNEINHVTAPQSGCFDDHEGDDSVDWPFYEAVMDILSANFCVDASRVFAAGVNTGANFANQLACKYAGHATYPIRAIGANKGGLYTEPEYRPTCSPAPMAGMWIGSTDYPPDHFDLIKQAVTHAMQINGCTIGTDYDSATFGDYPVDGSDFPNDTCRRMMGCPAEHPLVVCPLLGGSHASGYDNVANPGFFQFFTRFPP